MNTLKKIAIGLTLVSVMAGPSMAGQVMCGGSVPLINSIIGIGITSLDFSTAATSVQIADFVINNNSSSYTLSWTFQNVGNFALGGANTTGEPAVPMTLITIEEGAVTTGWGTGITWADLTPTPGTLGGTAVTATTAALAQTTATVNQEVIITASWAAAASTLMAGLYTETISFSIAATL